MENFFNHGGRYCWPKMLCARPPSVHSDRPQFYILAKHTEGLPLLYKRLWDICIWNVSFNILEYTVTVNDFQA